MKETVINNVFCSSIQKINLGGQNSNLVSTTLRPKQHGWGAVQKKSNIDCESVAVAKKHKILHL